MIFASADHRTLMPASMLLGAVVMLVCDLVSKQLGFPINTITALLGIPIVVLVVVRKKSLF
jgi:iron complex transport system permease protein